MTDFQVPPPPPPQYNNETGDSVAKVEPSAPQEQSSAVQEENAASSAIQNNVQKLREKTDELHQQFSQLPESKRNVIIYLAVFVIGLLLGWLLFGGSCDQPAPTPKGLSGVITNSDIKPQEKLKRCGLVSPSSPCVLYVMNHFTHEKLAKDFFETAVRLTGRPEYLIKSDNVLYGTMRIPPGYFAEIKIPMQR